MSFYFTRYTNRGVTQSLNYCSVNLDFVALANLWPIPVLRATRLRSWLTEVAICMHFGAALPGKIQASGCQSRSLKGGQSLLLVVTEHEITSVLQVVHPSPDSKRMLESDSLHMVTGVPEGAPKSRCGVVLAQASDYLRR